MIKRLPLALLLCTAVTGTATAAELTTDKQKFSYALGTQIGGNVAQQGIEIDADAFAAGIRDILTQTELQLSEAQMQQAAERYQQDLENRRTTAGNENSRKGRSFRAENRKSGDVEELDNGIQYRVLSGGDGGQPSVDDTVVVHYRGTLVNGEQFDSSYDRGEPAEFALNQVIQGWQEVLPLMQEGAKWQVVIPPELAYGERGAGAQIGPNETLIFDIELLEIK